MAIPLVTLSGTEEENLAPPFFLGIFQDFTKKSPNMKLSSFSTVPHVKVLNNIFHWVLHLEIKPNMDKFEY